VCKSGSSLKRCGRCKSVFFCSVECQRAGWPVHKLVCRESPLLSQTQLELLHRQGWCIIKNTSGVTCNEFVASWASFFSEASATKNRFRHVMNGTWSGYMTPSEYHETFEFARDRGPCPSHQKERTEKFFFWLEASATQCLREMLEFVSKSSFSWTNWKFTPTSTLRVLHYDRVGLASSAVLDSTFPCHTDSSFVTLAPKSSMAALESCGEKFFIVVLLKRKK
jgi:isopenicillin N synthase-like dioxygenase